MCVYEPVNVSVNVSVCESAHECVHVRECKWAEICAFDHISV